MFHVPLVKYRLTILVQVIPLDESDGPGRRWHGNGDKPCAHVALKDSRIT
jgi:hypothetical protein